jgi:LysM repeat protein
LGFSNTPIRRYNKNVHRNKSIAYLLALGLLIGLLFPAGGAQAMQNPPKAAQDGSVTAYDLIVAMNTLRTSNGLPALVEDPIIDAVAQSTAETMAANQMSWHIGNVSGRIQDAGYGGGVKVWATENFAVGFNSSIDQIMVMWSDADHMIPAVNAAYCNIGAGTAKAPNGMTYYILQAAYLATKACGEYKSVVGPMTNPSGSTDSGRAGGISQVIVPVKVATPDADGKIYHVVQAGQSFWSIAIAYKITIKDLKAWNNLNDASILQINEKLFIPDVNTKGYATPTPVGMIQLSKPDKDGKIVHTVQAYQTLSTIAQAYGTTVDALLGLNAIQIDWPLQIGQKLIVKGPKMTPTATPLPLTPLQKLTPASDGRYYHTVQNGENLSIIAKMYEITINELMAWNGLDGSSILQVNQKLVLQVTPPATATHTPGPPTRTAPPTQPPATATLARTPAPKFTATPASAPGLLSGRFDMFWVALGGLFVAGLLLFFFRKKNM